MSDFNRGYARSIPADRADMSVDAGLRSFMLGVYNKMALGLVLSAVLAWVTSSFPPVRDMLFVVANGRVGYSILGMVVAFAPLAVLLFSGFAIKNQTEKTASVVYWTVVSLIGASMGVRTPVTRGRRAARRRIAGGAGRADERPHHARVVGWAQRALDVRGGGRRGARGGTGARAHARDAGVPG